MWLRSNQVRSSDIRCRCVFCAQCSCPRALRSDFKAFRMQSRRAPRGVTIVAHPNQVYVNARPKVHRYVPFHSSLCVCGTQRETSSEIFSLIQNPVVNCSYLANESFLFIAFRCNRLVVRKRANFAKKCRVCPSTFGLPVAPSHDRKPKSARTSDV